MKRFISFVFYLLLVTGMVLIVTPVSWFPSFYDVRYMGYAAILEAGLVGVWWFLIKKIPYALRLEHKHRSVSRLQFLSAFVFFGNVLGDFGLYQMYRFGFSYDKLLHFLTPLVSVFIIAAVYGSFTHVHQLRAVLTAFIIVVLCAVAWEFWEYFADRLFNTHIFGVYGSFVTVDTIQDLIFDSVGALLGAICYIFYRRREDYKRLIFVRYFLSLPSYKLGFV